MYNTDDLSLEKIVKTIKVSEDAGVKFQVGFNRRFYKGYLAVKMKLDKGEINIRAIFVKAYPKYSGRCE